MTRHHSSSLRGPRPRPSDTPPPSKRLRHPHPPTLPTPWIIPARAGFTPRCQSWCACRWDHPRSRGVYSLPASPAPPIRGSSPLARGLPRWPLVPESAVRIIPARAGFTCALGAGGAECWDHPRSRGVYCSRASGRPPPADHPRSRGVYFAGLRDRCPPGGSSPLARGLHLPPEDRRIRRGIIPARAGFTNRRG